MYTKSKIQLIKESLQVKESMQEDLFNLMESYNIKDNIFVWSQNRIMEATRGYFQVEGEYEDLNEAVKVTNLNTQGIRVINNEKYQVGTIYKNLSECADDKQIFDIEKSEYTIE